MKKLVVFNLKIILFSYIALALTGCIVTQANAQNSRAKETCLEKILSLTGIKKAKLSHAEGFEIYSVKLTTILRVKKPWTGAKDQFIFLGKNLNSISFDHCQKNSLHFHKPVSRMASISTTHIPFMEVLDSLDILKGFSGVHYISSPKVIKKISEKKIENLGFPLNIEKVLKLRPDLLMAYSLEDPTLTGLGKLKKLGQKIVYNGEFRETHPLGRFEWIKLVGALIGKQKEANRIYNERKSEYIKLKRKVAQKGNKKFPFVLIGRNYQGSWHLPSANTYLSKLLLDAGAKQPWSKKTTKLFFPVNFETILKETNRTKFWLPQSPWNSKKEIIKEDPRYSLLKPFKNGSIYTNNKRINSNGGNDYWEGALVNPHLLLKDLVKIFHPDLVTSHELKWYKKI